MAARSVEPCELILSSSTLFVHTGTSCHTPEEAHRGRGLQPTFPFIRVRWEL